MSPDVDVDGDVEESPVVVSVVNLFPGEVVVR